MAFTGTKKIYVNFPSPYIFLMNTFCQKLSLCKLSCDNVTISKSLWNIQAYSNPLNISEIKFPVKNLEQEHCWKCITKSEMFFNKLPFKISIILKWIIIRFDFATSKGKGFFNRKSSSRELLSLYIFPPPSSNVIIFVFQG